MSTVSAMQIFHALDCGKTYPKAPSGNTAIRKCIGTQKTNNQLTYMYIRNHIMFTVRSN